MPPLQLRSDLHLMRKAWHVSTGTFGLYLYFIFNITPFAMGMGLMILSLVGFALDLTRLKYASFNQIVLSSAGIFMRECERHKFSGMPFYALGAGLALLLFDEKLALLAITFLVFSDPLSSVVGIIFGKDKILPNKSLQGTMAGFAMCSLLSLGFGFYLGVNDISLLYFSIIAGMIGPISELISAFGIDDNLSIPIFSGAGLTLLNVVIPIV